MDMAEVNKNHLNHNFSIYGIKHFIVSNIPYTDYKCNYCKVMARHFPTNNSWISFGDIAGYSVNLLSCAEYIIKSIIE